MIKDIRSKRLDKFPEYVFSKLAKTVKEIELSSGRKVLNFGPGTPDVRPSKVHLHKLKEFVDEPNSHLYPGYGAIPEFETALIKYYKKRFGVSITKDELFPLLGAKDGVSHVPLALCDAGDEVLIPDPGYSGYAGPTIMVGAKPVYYNANPELDVKRIFRELEKKITKKTKYIWVNFPANPTGQVATLEDLKKIVQIAKKHKVAIIYDNAYSEITFGGFVAPSILQVPGASGIAVEIGSFSKMSSFAGFRIGYIVGDKDLISYLSKIKSQIDSGLSLPFQKLAAFALDNPDKKWQKEMISSYKNRRDIIAKKLLSLGLEFNLPKGSLYIWAKIPDSEKDAETFSMRILKEKKVLLTPGSAFGKNGERYVRVSICINIDKIDEYF